MKELMFNIFDTIALGAIVFHNMLLIWHNKKLVKRLDHHEEVIVEIGNQVFKKRVTKSENNVVHVDFKR